MDYGCIQVKSRFKSSKILSKRGVKPKEYALATIHRPANLDSRKKLIKIIRIFELLSKELNKQSCNKIIFPVHPRTMKMVNSFGLTSRLANIENMIVDEPAGYTDFIKLLMDSKFVMTDSGGIQEEATFLRIPCLTLRDSFERAETLEIGTNTLCSLDEK